MDWIICATCKNPLDTYLALLVFVLDILGAHNVQQNLERNDHIRIDHGACLVAFLLWKASAVDDPHLLDDGGLA